MKDRAANRYISILYRYGQRYFTQALRASGVGLEVGQMPTFLQIIRNPGITQEGVAANAGIDKGTVARCVGQLEQLGFITRETDAEDRRINHLYPTARAHEIYPAVQNVLRGFHNLLYQGMSEEEAETVTRLLIKMKDNVTQQLQEKLKSDFF